MPGVSLHQDSAAGVQQLWDQFRIFIKFMDEQIVHDSQLPRIPISSHPDLAPTPLRLGGLHGLELNTILGICTFCGLKGSLYRGKGHAIEGHPTGMEIAQKCVRASKAVNDLSVLFRHL